MQVTTVRVSVPTRDELDSVHRELKSEDTRFRSKDAVILELIDIRRKYLELARSVSIVEDPDEFI